MRILQMQFIVSVLSDNSFQSNLRAGSLILGLISIGNSSLSTSHCLPTPHCLSHTMCLTYVASAAMMFTNTLAHVDNSSRVAPPAIACSAP